MSATSTSSNGPLEPTPTATTPAKKARRRHTPGGVRLGQQAGREARRLATAILEVLAGARTPGQAAEALGVSLSRYFQLETRAMHGLLAACEARPRGPGPSAEKELAALQRQHERLQRELNRQQTLVRLAQRTVGLAPPRADAEKPGGKGKERKRRRRPVVRALRAAVHLQEQSQEEALSGATSAPTPENRM